MDIFQSVCGPTSLIVIVDIGQGNGVGDVDQVAGVGGGAKPLLVSLNFYTQLTTYSSV